MINGASRGITRSTSGNITFRCSSQNTGSSTSIIRATSRRKGPAALTRHPVATVSSPPGTLRRTACTRPPRTSHADQTGGSEGDAPRPGLFQKQHPQTVGA
jgi:hypothetical protein